MIYWFTGQPSSGKTTLGNKLYKFLKTEKRNWRRDVFHIDGDDLRNITTRFGKHFDNIKVLRKKLEEAMKVTDDFGRDARSITRTLENIKDPEQIETAVQTENVEKFVNNQKQIKN